MQVFVHALMAIALLAGSLVAPAPVAAGQPHASVTVARTPSVAAAKAYARRAIGATQYACLNQIAIHESHWNPRDRNPRSGAYGIFQALPPAKMARYGSDWRTNPITQTKFGIGYVRARYGSACNAWRFWVRHRWF